MDPNDPLVSTLHSWTKIFMRHSMREFILYSKQCGLSMSQIGALFRINESKSRVSRLGGGLGITNAAVSQMLDRLVQQGLILRSEDPDDRRAKQLVLTDRGRQILDESLQARQSWINGLSEVLSAEEKKQVIAALNLLIKKANQLEPVSGGDQ
jgi:DNA-binding MarR family transcriptional regulator